MRYKVIFDVVSANCKVIQSFIAIMVEMYIMLYRSTTFSVQIKLCTNHTQYLHQISYPIFYKKCNSYST